MENQAKCYHTVRKLHNLDKIVQTIINVTEETSLNYHGNMQRRDGQNITHSHKNHTKIHLYNKKGRGTNESEKLEFM